MSTEMRLALVGCGAIAQLHVPAIRQGASRTRITATVDVDRDRAEALARETGATAFTSLDEALAEDACDAVDLMLPHALHEEAACAAFAAGRHVLLEKPMAPTPEACARILDAARGAGTVFMVAENAQYWPEVVTAKRLIDEGAIGEVVSARATFTVPPLEMFYPAGSWRLSNDAAGGGIAIDTGSHWIRPLRMWLGEVDEVVGATGCPWAAMEGESLVRALLRFRSGVVATLEGLMTEAPSAGEPLFRVTGSRGEILIDPRGVAVLYDEARRNGEPQGEPGGYLASFPEEFADFEAAILDGRRPAAGPEVALGELRVALALYRSAASKQWEKVWA